MPWAQSPGDGCATRLAFDVYEPEASASRAGDCGTVLLVHSMKTTSLVWFQTVPHLVAQGFRCITFDLRGFGRSAPAAVGVPDEESVHPRHYVQDALAVLDAAGVPEKAPVALVCLALGGWTGLPCALRYPARFRCLVLCCSPGGVLPKALLEDLARCDAEAAHSAAAEVPRGGVGQWEDEELAAGFAVQRPDLALLFRAMGGAVLPARFTELLRECNVTPAAAAACRVPVLFIIGAQDRAWAPSALARVAALIGTDPGGCAPVLVEQIPQAGHTLPLETPGAFHRTLDPFLAAHMSAADARPAAGRTTVTAAASIDAIPVAAPVQVLDDRFAGLFMNSIPRVISTGHTFTEGPVWCPDAGEGGGQLLFSDIPQHKIHHWRARCGAGIGNLYNVYSANDESGAGTGAEGGGSAGAPADGRVPGVTGLFRANTCFGNGSCLDARGRLVTCEHGSRRVSRTTLPVADLTSAKPDAIQTETLADCDAAGKKLTSPNDVVVDREGRVWFTDPDYGTDAGEGHGLPAETRVNGVYCASGDVRDPRVRLVVEDCVRPNGLLLTPDERHLLVADSGTVLPGGAIDPALPRTVRRYSVTSDNETGEVTCSGGEVVVQHDATARRPDGMTFDALGNLYVATARGVEVFAAGSFAPLGVVRLPQSASNCIFGGPERKHLFITAVDTVWRIEMRVPGFEPFRVSDPGGAVISDAALSHAVDEVAEVALRQIARLGVTRAQLDAGIAWLRRVGAADEWEDVLDMFAITQAVDEAGYAARSGASPTSGATPPVIIGPFYRPGAPRRTVLCPSDQPGTPLRVRGTVRMLGCQHKIAGATLDVWGANERARYDHEEPHEPEFNLRGVVPCADDGTYCFTTRLPGNYSVPYEGPTAEFLRAMNRTFVRAAHLHLIVRAPGCHELVTQLYFAHDSFAPRDSVRAVLPQLLVDVHDDGTGTLEGVFDIVLVQQSG
eukprot:Hpha_TRINITY_DN34191_c0_g1::TRINITY_DN34191_c0_g1_i1::g.75917::m.75917/K01053/E3.1.1.17, gnl, RGN; gluconolactonase